MDRADEQRPDRLMQEESKGTRGIRKPTVQRKGNKKGDIAVMTELWVEKGYKHLGI